MTNMETIHIQYTVTDAVDKTYKDLKADLIHYLPPQRRRICVRQALAVIPPVTNLALCQCTRLFSALLFTVRVLFSSESPVVVGFESTGSRRSPFLYFCTAIFKYASDSRVTTLS